MKFSDLEGNQGFGQMLLTPRRVRRGFSNLPQELQDIYAGDSSILGPIDPLEGGMRFEFWQCSEFLSLGLQHLLTSLESDEELLEKHHHGVCKPALALVDSHPRDSF